MLLHTVVVLYSYVILIASGRSMIGTKEGLNKEDLGLKLKIKGEFTLNYSN